jgi:hypothetical protein
MHHALEIPELVQHILGYLTQNDQGRCALVCTTWSEIALDYAWYRVGDLYDGPSFVDLARLIAPVKETSSGEYVCVLFFNVIHVFLSAAFPS